MGTSHLRLILSSDLPQPRLSSSSWKMLNSSIFNKILFSKAGSASGPHPTCRVNLLFLQQEVEVVFHPLEIGQAL